VAPSKPIFELLMKTILILSGFLLVTGCIPFPTYKTLQPESSITVVDLAGVPIDFASAQLISSSYPYGYEKFRVITKTSTSGKASFTKIKQWKIEAPLMMHGAEYFFWNWCISKEGYKTFQTRYTSSTEFNNASFITLYPGSSKACSEEHESWQPQE
jgi:cytochrome c oxidase assembly factor CtaG